MSIYPGQLQCSTIININKHLVYHQIHIIHLILILICLFVYQTRDSSSDQAIHDWHGTKYFSIPHLRVMRYPTQIARNFHLRRATANMNMNGSFVQQGVDGFVQHHPGWMLSTRWSNSSGNIRIRKPIAGAEMRAKLLKPSRYKNIRFKVIQAKYRAALEYLENGLVT